VARSESSKSSSIVIFWASPPPNWAVGRPWPTTGWTFHLLLLAIVYSAGLNQQSIWLPPSSLR
jgi:hypothetical protein